MIQELESRIRRWLTNIGEFRRVHPLPHGAHEVTDDTASKLVVLGADHTYTQDPDSLGELAAKNILESRGAGPRMYRNTVVFLAPDKARMEELEDSARRYLAWQSIIDDKDQLDLTQAQIRQAEDQKEAADGTTTVRISETYQWLLVPTQSEQSLNHIEFRPTRLSGQAPIAVRASKRLVNEELVITNYSPTLLRMEMDRVPLWRPNMDHIQVKQLAEDFASYLRLPRLQDSLVIGRAVEQGISLLTWKHDSFAFADGYDEGEGRYQGLRFSQTLSVSIDGPGLLVKPDVARKQIDFETQKPEPPGSGGNGGGDPPPPPPPPVKVTKRYHASVKLVPLRPRRDASQIAEEVIGHLSGLMGANVEVRLEIQAYVPGGVPDNIVRIVIEYWQTLKFEDHGFEEG